MDNIIIEQKFPTNEEFNFLLKSVDWGVRSDDKINKIRQASCYALSAYINGKIIGTVRVLGDGINYIVYDLIVDKKFQNLGVGSMLMQKLINWYLSSADGSTKLSLFSASGVEAFYEKLGFVKRPFGYLGAGMIYHEKKSN